MSTLFHVSKSSERQWKKGKGFIEEFIPRVPKLRMFGEDSTTPRVCMTYDLEGCLLAIPKMHLMGEDSTIVIHDKELTGKIFTVYEFDIDDDDENFIPCIDLDDSMVPDAFITGECWYKAPITPSRTYHIMVHNCDMLSKQDTNYRCHYTILG